MTERLESTDRSKLKERIVCYFGPTGDSRALLGWTFGWAVAFVGASWLLRGDSDMRGGLTFVVAAVPNLLAVAVVLVYLRFLRQADELVKRIQLEGLAFGFGVGVIFSMGYQLLERAGAPELSFSDMAAIMMFAFVVGVVRANRRYS